MSKIRADCDQKLDVARSGMMSMTVSAPERSGEGETPMRCLTACSRQLTLMFSNMNTKLTCSPMGMPWRMTARKSLRTSSGCTSALICCGVRSGLSVLDASQMAYTTSIGSLVHDINVTLGVLITGSGCSLLSNTTGFFTLSDMADLLALLLSDGCERFPQSLQPLFQFVRTDVEGRSDLDDADTAPEGADDQASLHGFVGHIEDAYIAVESDHGADATNGAHVRHALDSLGDDLAHGLRNASVEVQPIHHPIDGEHSESGATERGEVGARSECLAVRHLGHDRGHREAHAQPLGEHGDVRPEVAPEPVSVAHRAGAPRTRLNLVPDHGRSESEGTTVNGAEPLLIIRANVVGARDRRQEHGGAIFPDAPGLGEALESLRQRAIAVRVIRRAIAARHRGVRAPVIRPGDRVDGRTRVLLVDVPLPSSGELDRSLDAFCPRRTEEHVVHLQLGAEARRQLLPERPVEDTRHVERNTHSSSRRTIEHLRVLCRVVSQRCRSAIGKEVDERATILRIQSSAAGVHEGNVTNGHCGHQMHFQISWLARFKTSAGASAPVGIRQGIPNRW